VAAFFRFKPCAQDYSLYNAPSLSGITKRFEPSSEAANKHLRCLEKLAGKSV
jgi:hypothetical protein